MDTSRKPLWPKVMATVFVLLLLYPLAVGPWVYVRMRFGPPEPFSTVGDILFLTPGSAMIEVLPEPLAEPYKKYVFWCALEGKSHR